jgi:hypothetical protein
MESKRINVYVLPALTYLISKPAEITVGNNTLTLTDKRSGQVVLSSPITQLSWGIMPQWHLLLLSDGTRKVRLLFTNPRRIAFVALASMLLLAAYIISFGLPSYVFLAVLAVYAPFNSWIWSKEAHNAERLQLLQVLKQDGLLDEPPTVVDTGQQKAQSVVDMIVNGTSTFILGCIATMGTVLLLAVLWSKFLRTLVDINESAVPTLLVTTGIIWVAWIGFYGYILFHQGSVRFGSGGRIAFSKKWTMYLAAAPFVAFGLALVIVVATGLK